MSINTDEVDAVTGLPKVADEEAAKKKGTKTKEGRFKRYNKDQKNSYFTSSFNVP